MPKGHVVGHRTVVTAVKNRISPTTAAAHFKEKTGLEIEREYRLMNKIEDVFNMLTADFGCNLNSGDYHKVIQSFSEAVAEGNVEIKQRCKAETLQFFVQSTSFGLETDQSFCSAYSKFISRENWQEHRDQSYVELAAFTAEIRHMCDYVHKKFNCSDDRVKQAKARYAKEFSEIFENTLSAMKQAGGLSQEALDLAGEAQAQFFPTLIRSLKEEIATAPAEPKPIEPVVQSFVETVEESRDTQLLSPKKRREFSETIEKLQTRFKETVRPDWQFLCVINAENYNQNRNALRVMQNLLRNLGRAFDERVADPTAQLKEALETLHGIEDNVINLKAPDEHESKQIAVFRLYSHVEDFLEKAIAAIEAGKSNARSA